MPDKFQGYDEQFEEAFQYLAQELRKEASRLAKCGGIDPGAYRDKPFLFVQSVLRVSMENCAARTEPCNSDDIENLRHF